jgi:hypothetical protein
MGPWPLAATCTATFGNWARLGDLATRAEDPNGGGCYLQFTTPAGSYMANANVTFQVQHFEIN